MFKANIQYSGIVLFQYQVHSWHKSVAGVLDSQSLSDNIPSPKSMYLHQVGVNTNSPVCKIYLFSHTNLSYGEKPNDELHKMQLQTQ